MSSAGINIAAKFAVFFLLHLQSKIDILEIRLKKGVAKITRDMKQYIVGGISNRDNSITIEYAISGTFLKSWKY